MKRAGTAMILISGLAALSIWIQPEPRVRPPEAPPAPSRSLDPNDAPHLLERFMARHEKAADGETGLRFDREKRTGVTEARLLALALPETLRPLLERVAGDPARPDKNREFAIRILGFLPGAEESLVRLAGDGNRRVAAAAVQVLASIDRAGAHLSVYLAKCDDGFPEAFDAVSPWTDSRAIGLLRKTSTPPHLAGRLRGRFEILYSADWAQQVEEILGDPCHEGNDLAPWALRVARSRALPGLASSLRDRLDQGTPDDFRDDVLVALSELSGELTPSEQERLQSFGYLGDPAARLRELLGLR